MIARITGTVVDTFEKGAVVETGGIGYAIYTPFPAQLGEKVTLHTQLVVRDDSQELYGFQTLQEKNLFLKLTSVSGVGPKSGLQILSLYPLAELVRIIKSGDAKAVSLSPGIGKKTAEKIIIDLKDKLNGFESTESEPQNDLVEALLSLGYKEYQIRPLLGTVDAQLPLPGQITAALKLLQK
jgi:holliday junction DNA helicase RuvA